MKSFLSVLVSLALVATGFGQQAQKIENAIIAVAPRSGGPLQPTAGVAFGIVDNDGNVLANGRTGILAIAAGATIGGSAVVALGTITSASANALTVGRLGATTPAFNVDASTAVSITGLNVKSAGTGGGVALSAIGETNVAMTLDAAGSGTLLLNGTATGAVDVGDVTNPSFQVVHTTEGTGVKITSAAAASGVAIAAISSGTDENMTINAKGAGTLTLGGTQTGNNIMNKAVVTPQTTAYATDGAITIASGIATLTKGSAGAYTLAAPSSQNGTRITILSLTDFAHVVTVTGGCWDGTATTNTTLTFSVVRGACCTLIANGTAWYTESLNAVVPAP